MSKSVQTEDLLSREEIAKLMNISANKLSQRLAMSKAYQSFPKPVGKSGKHLLYERKAAIKWLADNGIETAVKATLLDFISGKFDRKELKIKHQFKCIASKHIKPKTVTVRIRAEF